MLGSRLQSLYTDIKTKWSTKHENVRTSANTSSQIETSTLPESTTASGRRKKWMSRKRLMWFEAPDDESENGRANDGTNADGPEMGTRQTRGTGEGRGRRSNSDADIQFPTPSTSQSTLDMGISAEGRASIQARVDRDSQTHHTSDDNNRGQQHDRHRDTQRPHHHQRRHHPEPDRARQDRGQQGVTRRTREAHMQDLILTEDGNVEILPSYEDETRPPSYAQVVAEDENHNSRRPPASPISFLPSMWLGRRRHEQRQIQREGANSREARMLRDRPRSIQSRQELERDWAERRDVIVRHARRREQSPLRATFSRRERLDDRDLELLMRAWGSGGFGASYEYS